MILINDILKERLIDKLSLKMRYNFNKLIRWRYKTIYNLDNINYCLYRHYDSSKPITVSIFYYWFRDNKLHRDDDEFGNEQPAFINNKTHIYYYLGKYIKTLDITT